MARLPVSGVEIAPRAPDGVDDMLLHEAAGSPVEAGLALLARLCGDTFDCAELVVTDFEFLLLTVRAARFGQQMMLGFRCPHCQAVAEVNFSVADYLADVTPRAAGGVMPDPVRTGWFRLDAAGFRLPTASDPVAVAGTAQPARRLGERCLDDLARGRPYRARVERAMAVMAPELSRPVAGHCPSCGVAVQAGLSVTRVVVAELARAASTVYDEVDLIARAYHWPETMILALPPQRRRAYVERIRRSFAQAA
jgi:hypothetical protein